MHSLSKLFHKQLSVLMINYFGDFRFSKLWSPTRHFMIDEKSNSSRETHTEQHSNRNGERCLNKQINSLLSGYILTYSRLYDIWGDYEQISEVLSIISDGVKLTG